MNRSGGNHRTGSLAAHPSSVTSATLRRMTTGNGRDHFIGGTSSPSTNTPTTLDKTSGQHPATPIASQNPLSPHPEDTHPG
jgi:hypothetical protein